MESKFVGVNILFILIYPNQDGNVKRYNGKKCYLPKITKPLSTKKMLTTNSLITM